MPTFRYAAKDMSGRAVVGVLDSPDERALANVLRQQQLIIISIRPEVKKMAFSLKTFGRRGKIKLPELVLFSRQFATMIDSGIPLVQALEILTDQIEHPRFKKIIGEIKKDVSTGSTFHEALAKHPQAFSPLFVNMAKAGESSGALDDIMERLASYLEKTDSLVRKVRSALIYPIVVSVMAVLITLVLMLKVVPVFKSIFADFGGKLPLPTTILLATSDFLIQYFFIWSGLLAVGIFLLVRFFRTEIGATLLDNYKLNMPVFGTIFRKVAVSKFSRTLATLVKSGVPILSALEIVSKTAGNRMIEKAVNNVRISIREGESISEPLMKSKVFPPLVTRMVALGEETGQLDRMLAQVADSYEEEVEVALNGLTQLLEPLLIVFVGGIVGFIVIAMFLPLLSLTKLLG